MQTDLRKSPIFFFVCVCPALKVARVTKWCFFFFSERVVRAEWSVGKKLRRRLPVLAQSTSTSKILSLSAARALLSPLRLSASSSWSCLVPSSRSFSCLILKCPIYVFVFDNARGLSSFDPFFSGRGQMVLLSLFLTFWKWEVKGFFLYVFFRVSVYNVDLTLTKSNTSTRLRPKIGITKQEESHSCWYEYSVLKICLLARRNGDSLHPPLI